MKISETRIILVPGEGEAGANHWLSRWQTRLATARRLQPLAHGASALAHDVAALRKAVQEEGALPVVLVCHAAGCHVALHAVHDFPQGRVRGAFLVAPPLVHGPQARAAGMPPVPHGQLPFPSVLVASRNDPAADYARSEALAGALGASFVDAGEAGGLDDASGFGPWPEGLLRFGTFLRSLGPATPV
ncbi:MAG: alpha/beta hydrolase [Hyphomicrobiales bacterium]|nr:alpha/beta hydrolase [Hyphomicrobiales bacterium]